MKKRYLILGNGVAGTTAAETIRKHDPKGSITILTDEMYPFYLRTRLNDFISGEIEQEKLITRKPKWYKERQIKLLPQTSAREIILPQNYVRTREDAALSFDSLLIATGSKPFMPPIQGAGTPGVFPLRTLTDALQIISFSKSIKKVVLIGGGLLGLETGNALRKRGKDVTVVEFFPRLLPQQLDGRGARILQRMMSQMGFSFFLESAVSAIDGKNSVKKIVLDTGKQIPADMVIISAGVRPEIKLAQEANLCCNRGIIVNSNLRTSIEGIYAAGDAAEHNGIVYGMWSAAMQQGRIAGANMAGTETVYQGTVKANKLKVAGIDLASAGDIDPENIFRAQITETETAYQKIVTEGDQILGCIMLGDTTNFASVTRAMKTSK